MLRGLFFGRHRFLRIGTPPHRTASCVPPCAAPSVASCRCRHFREERALGRFGFAFDEEVVAILVLDPVRRLASTCPRRSRGRIAILRRRTGFFRDVGEQDRKSTRLNSSHSQISYAVFCLKKKNNTIAYIYSLHT